MNILIVTNYYPPFFKGGFEWITFDLVHCLEERMHHVSVLTSSYASQASASNLVEPNVYRWLPEPLQTGKVSAITLLRYQVSIKRTVDKLIKQTSPDLIFVTGMTGLPASTFGQLQDYKIPRIYVAFDRYWIDYPYLDRWEKFWRHYSKNSIKKKVKRVASFIVEHMGLKTRVQPDSDGMWFGSRYLMTAYNQVGLLAQKSILLYPLIAAAKTNSRLPERSINDPLRLLFAGRICKEKGILTVLQSLMILKEMNFRPMPTLSVVGSAPTANFQKVINQFIQNHSIASHIFFLGQKSREEMVEMYQNHHVLLFATEIQEPFGMIPLEAMASGTAVIATSTGGTSEYLENNQNALVLPAGDAAALARHISSLTNDEKLRRHLISQGYDFASKFTDRNSFIESIETFMYEILECKETA